MTAENSVSPAAKKSRNRAPYPAEFGRPHSLNRDDAAAVFKLSAPA